MSPSVRSLVPLVIGLVIGGVGAVMFQQSLPGAEGSAQEQVIRLERDLKRAENQIAALEAADPRAKRRSGRTLADGARSIAEDFKEGRPVTPDDIFRATQPIFRDLAPIFDRMRVVQQKGDIERMTGELARKYDLTAPQQQSLKKWFEGKAEENAKRWTDAMTQEGMTTEDMVRTMNELRPDDGLDAFMEKTLSGEKLAAFQSQRMTERVERVQQDADARTQRLDNIVQLDDSQRDQIFGIMARNSNDYDPAMKLEGADGEIATTTGRTHREALLSVLRPDQREKWEAEQTQRREKAAKELAEMGLSLPPDWDPMQEEFN
jgi:hypothetical protein